MINDYFFLFWKLSLEEIYLISPLLEGLGGGRRISEKIRYLENPPSTPSKGGPIAVIF